MANINDLTVDKGSDYSQTITFRDSGGVAIDLTSYTADMQVRSCEGSPILLELTTTLVSGAGIVLGGSTGTIQIIIPAAVSAVLAAGQFQYDLEVAKISTGVRTRVEQGVFYLISNITS